MSVSTSRHVFKTTKTSGTTGLIGELYYNTYTNALKVYKTEAYCEWVIPWDDEPSLKKSPPKPKVEKPLKPIPLPSTRGGFGSTNHWFRVPFSKRKPRRK